LSLIIKISSENFTVLLNKMGKGIIAFLADSGRIIRNGLKKIRYTSRYIVNLLFKALQRTLAETRKALAGAAAILRQLGKLVKKEFLRIFHFFRFCIGTIYKNRRRIFSSVNLLFHIWPRKLLLFGILLIDFLLFLLHFGVAKGIHWFHRLIIKTGKGIYLTGKGIFYFLGRVERAVFRILSIPALAMALILQNLWISSKWLAGLFKKTGQKIYFLIKQILKILFSGGRAFFASSKKILIRGFSAVVSFLGLPGKALVFLFSRAWKWLLLGNRKISRFSNRILKFAGRGFSLFNFSQWGKNTLQQGRKTAFNTGKFILQLRYYAVLFLAGNIRRFIRKTANYLRGIFYLFRLLDWGRASLRVAIKRIFLGIRFRFRLGSGARSFYVFFIKKLIRIFHRIFNVCAFFFGAVKWGLKRLLKSWKRIRWVLKRLRGSAKALVKVARNLFRLRDFTIRFSRSWIKFLNIYRLGRKLESRGMSRIKKAFTRCVKLDQNVKQKTISGLRLFFRVFLFYYRKIFFFFKAENWGLREILKALRKSLKWQIRSLFSMQFVQKRIVKTAKFCVSMARFLEKLAHWKFRSVNRIHSRKESYGKRVENRIKFLLRLKIKLIRSLILTNWLKKGYQLSILLIISLTLYSFTRYPGLWKRQETLAEKKAVFPKVKVALDIKEKSLIEQLTVNLSPEIEITPEKKEGDFILSDRYEKNSVPVYFKGAAIVVHGENPLKNLSLLQLQNILNRKTVRWDAIGWKDIPVEIYVDRSIDFMKFQPSENFLLSNMETIRQRLKTRKGALAVVALKNLDLSLKPVMVDYAYPTRSQIFLKQYPLGKFAVLKKVPGSGVALEKIVKHFPPVPFKSIMAGGDVIWDRGVANSIARNGVSYLIEDLKPLFKTADIAFANLENPVSIRGDKYNLDKGIFFRANPAYMNILTDMGINLVSLSNNHMFDYGMTAALDTVHHLNQNKIHYVGFGLNREEAAKGKTYELGSRKIKFMGYNTVYPYNVDAKENTPGILMVNHETLKKEIRKAKKGTDYLIIAIHSGKEYDYYPEKEKQELYRKMIDYGADIILGSHPHVTQTIEYYKNKPIVYSTGNLLFDQYRFSKTRDEMVVELNFYKGRLISLSPHFFKVNSQFKPVAVRNRDVEFLLSRIHKLNDDIKISQKKKEEKVGN
jgi:poly-gamma-glutamate synthesis protein (capsule biosynthesis protein)